MDKPGVRVALCQIDPTVGDIDGNASKIISRIKEAEGNGADIIAFPELALTGYPPEDLLIKKSFIDANLKAVRTIAASAGKAAVVVGFVNRKKGGLFNSAAVLRSGKIVGVYDKVCLPNYGVFDEKRYFSQGTSLPVFNINGLKFAVVICEDIWHDKGPAKKLAGKGLDLLLAINASPFHAGKWKDRESAVKALAGRTNAVAYLNLVGGQDELVFDGHSFVMGKNKKLIARGKQFEEDIVYFVAPLVTGHRSLVTAPYSPIKEIYSALCLGLKDYVRKNGFKKVILGLSGGIDSALTAAIAADALGKENVKAIFMPSRYSASQSRDDSIALAGSLGIELMEISIENIFSSFLTDLSPYFSGSPANIAEENLQARIRGTLLMAFSNKFGYLVLATGNKSEVSTGYSTLYGDMAGGLSVIKDVPKTTVYELARYRNTVSLVIPDSIIERAPTAELRPNQKDQDSLPPYDVLDRIIHEYVENDKSADRISALGFDKKLVHDTVRLIDKNEYKRRQSAPGIKITPKAFGKDRRLPITNGFKE